MELKFGQNYKIITKKNKLILGIYVGILDDSVCFNKGGYITKVEKEEIKDVKLCN